MPEYSSRLRAEFNSRKEFMERLGEMLVSGETEDQLEAEEGEETRGRPTELKTFIMESNDTFDRVKEATTIMGSLSNTNLPNISILSLKSAGVSTGFYVDTVDPRFPVLYTNDLAKDVDLHYNRLINSTSNRFDKTWFPKEILQKISHLPGNRFTGFGLEFNDLFAEKPVEEQPINELRMNVIGSSSEEALEALTERYELKRSLCHSMIRAVRGDREGFVTDEIRYLGRIISKSGESIDDHMSLVQAIKKIYRNLIEEIERNGIGTKKVEDRTLVEGQAFDLVLDRQIEDLDSFLNHFLVPTQPFRLWGLRNKVSEETRRIVAVDLHTGDPIDLEITRSLIRIYLPKDSCGNTVLRMYVNLQHNFDSAIRVNDEKLTNAA